MAITSHTITPLADALHDLEVAAGHLFLVYKELGSSAPVDLHRAVEALGAALWELQETRARVADLVLELGTPPLHVVVGGLAGAGCQSGR